MKLFRSLLLSLAGALCCASFAQTATPAASTDTGIANLYMAGGSYSAGASPAFAGSALYAHQINQSGTYAFTMLDALPGTTKPFTVTTNIGVGVGQKVLTIANVPIFVPTDVGISWTGTNTGWAWSTGAGAIFQLSHNPAAKGNWYVMPTARVLKSSVGSSTYQPVVGVLLGWGQ